MNDGMRGLNLRNMPMKDGTRSLNLWNIPMKDGKSICRIRRVYSKVLLGITHDR